jgi:radical SAM superfamily enzyme YgiQ (UPF0313 family)
MAQILEFTLKEDPLDIAQKILSVNPQILGLAVYIWNTDETLCLVSILKKLNPNLIIVVGGPEVSFEFSKQEICNLANFVVSGEGEDIFYKLCSDLLSEKSGKIEKYLKGPLPDIQHIKLPYSFYSDEDIRNRVIYVEASRGCPFKCEYCLSSLDKKVRAFSLDVFLCEMQKLIDRGARQFKFVDRTFNLDIKSSKKILEFFLNQIERGLFLHFEMVPDRFPDELKEIVLKFPDGALQFEIGVQTWNPEVAAQISRKQDYKKIKENMLFLSQQSGVHIHADLIAGLPGEDLKSFAFGFDQLHLLKPHEIQVGILKRLRGTPISYENEKRGLFFADFAPYQILYSKHMSFEDILKVRRFSFYWDTFANSGNFVATKNYLDSVLTERSNSWFWFFDGLCDFFSSRHRNLHSISLLGFLESLYLALLDLKYLDSEQIKKVLIEDYATRGKRSVPKFLLNSDSEIKFANKKMDQEKLKTLPDRQNKHLN